QGGPVLIVEGLGTSPQLQAARRQARPGPRTLRAMIGEAIAKAKRRLAAFVALLILVLGAGVYGVYWLLSGEVQQTERERRTAGDSARAETERLRQELAAARATAAPAALAESLRAQLRAAGYRLTNWHVVADSQHARPDTIWVTMADQAQARLAEVISASQDRDIAVLKMRGYQGPYLSAIDWAGTKARQGDPAALIGFPAGSGFARLRSALVRTSMTAGIISRGTDDVIQFDGMTIGGSSGSPLFNANGEVIAIHRAGLPQAPGFALAVPIKHAVPLLPSDLKQRLGLR